MARNDIFVNINAISPADAFVTGQQDMTAADAPELILGDTPTFNFYFTDNTNTWPSWAGNAAYTVTWALSDAVSGDFAPAATTGNATPITGGWSIDLPLNAYDLVGLLNSKRISQAYPVTYLWQQIRVTAPTGKEVTRAMVYTPIRYRAISDTQNTESATPTGGRFVTVNNTNDLTTPTLAQFYDANPVPASALPLGLGTDTAPANGELLIGNGSGYVTSTLTAGTGVTITNGAGSITIDATGAQELLTATVKNAEAVPITKGQVVYLYSATGGFPSVKLAYNTGDATSAKTFGVVSDTSIAANGTGTITCVGVVDGLNLGGFSDGDTVYLGATPGSITATKPYAPNHLVYVGIIERANAGNGELYVKVQNGYELDEIHDVQITSAPAAGALLMRDATNSLWKANRLSAGTNIAVTNADTSVTIGLTGTVAVANGGTGVTTSTGSGSVVLSTSPSLTTPILGTPQSGTLTNCTGLPVSTGVSGLGSGVATFLATPSSANLRSAVTDETGTGALVFANTPSLVTPDIGAATGTSATLTGNANVSDVRLGGTSGPSAKSSIAARAARQGLVFDGSLAASISPVPSAFGTGDFTISYFVRHNTITTSQEIHYNGGLAGYKANGNYYVDVPGVTGVISATYSNQDKTTLITLTRSGTTATLYFNGVSVATASSSSNITSGINVLGSTGNGIIGCISNFTIYNRALSAAEVVSLYEAGVPSGSDYNSASNTLLNTSTALNAYSTSFTTFTGASATGFTASDATASKSPRVIFPLSGTLVAGRRYRAKFTATLTAMSSVNLWQSDSSYAGLSNLGAVSSGSNEFTFTATSSVNAMMLLCTTDGSVGTHSVVISGLSVDTPGLLLAPDAAQAGGGLTWYDTSGNAANITLPASGVTWNVPTSGKMATSLNVNAAASLFASTSNSTSISDVDTTAALISKGSGTPRLYFGNDNAANRPFLQAGVGGGSLFMVLQPYGGNVLVGALTDSGNGKLQLVTHTTSAGGIGFGTDTSLYRAAAQSLNLDGASSPQFSLSVSGTQKARLESYSDDLYISTLTAGKSIILRSGNAATALTLDSSQNATFAGTVTAVGISSFKRSDNTGSIRLIPSSGVSAGSDIESFNGSTSAFSRLNTRGTHLQVYTGTSANTLALTVDDSQNATFAGRVRAASGSGSSVSFGFSSEVNTGLYLPYANWAQFVVGGNSVCAFLNSYNGATGGMVLVNNLTVAPTSNPAGGGFLYCEGGALKYRGSSGTVTTIANA